MDIDRQPQPVQSLAEGRDTTVRPRFPRDLVCFSHLRWNFVFQRPQHLLTRGARDHRVFFIEEPVRIPAREPRMAIRHDRGITIAVPEIPDGLTQSQEVALQRTLIDGLLNEQGVTEAVFWYYTPLALAFTDHHKPALTVYDNMDELSAFRGASPDLLAHEAKLFSRSDVIFTGGQSLYEAKRARHPNVHAFPSSIDKAHFAVARASRAQEATDQAPRPGPWLGFFGVIDERMDVDLVGALADRRPDWQIVMIGPVVKIDPATLPLRPNLHWIGARGYAQLPAYLAGWDVGIMPFAINEATRFISPTKTPEFLAAGVPVVSTPIRDVVRPYGEAGLVEIAETAVGFERAVEAILARPRGPWLAQVDAFLADQSWDATWRGMRTTMASALRKAKERPTMRRDGVRLRRHDWLVVGAGFAGSVLAERLAADGNQRVLVIDKRPHIAGNAFDCRDEAGLLIHRYGPHIFHTNAETVFDHLSRFTTWRPYEHRVLSAVDGLLLPVPINLDTVNRLYGLSLTSAELEDWLKARAEPVETIRTAEDVVVSTVGRDLYEKFFRGYTRKQWGVDPSQLDKSVTARVPTRTDRDDRYFQDKFQAMPREGYTAMFRRMLDHPNITVELGVDFEDLRDRDLADRIIYTGPVDAYFDHCYGPLPYRSLRFAHVTRDEEWHQPVAVVNYPTSEAYTRVTEYKHLTGETNPRTSLTYEYPSADGDPYYPIPRPENAALYRRYEELTRGLSNVHFVGRLATYKYYNMDQVVGQALAT